MSFVYFERLNPVCFNPKPATSGWAVCGCREWRAGGVRLPVIPQEAYVSSEPQIAARNNFSCGQL